MSGSLRSASSGSPLPGKLLKFLARDVALCSAITGNDGRASCEAVLGSDTAWAAFEWRVVFEGDSAFDAGESAAPPVLGSIEARASR